LRGSSARRKEFNPSLVALFDEEGAEKAEKALSGSGIKVLSGPEGIVEAAALDGVDTVVSAIVGAAGLVPTYSAVAAGKVVALANKESLVAAGSLITAEAKRTGARLLPVDSEHSAIFQTIMGQDRNGLRRIILTASGGPFYGKGYDMLEKVTPAMALEHPRWEMGPKVTVDSATMMNKGLEIIEAHWLFGVPAENIDVVVHPQSVVHSLVEYVDGSMLAQMGVADMRLPIAFALGYPERVPLTLDPLDLTRVGKLEFFEPDMKFFPCLKLAYEVLERGGTIPAVMNAANEVAVEAFLDGRLSFRGICQTVSHTVKNAPDGDDSTLAKILEADGWARRTAGDYIEALKERR